MILDYRIRPDGEIELFDAFSKKPYRNEDGELEQVYELDRVVEHKNDNAPVDKFRGADEYGVGCE